MNQYVCRCCLKENPNQVYKIFDKCQNLFEDLKLCLPASWECEHNDGLPQIVCNLCWQQVQQFKNFRQQCLLADEELRNRYATYKNQVVEEVLSLIGKLKQQDNNNNDNSNLQEQELSHINEKHLTEMDCPYMGTTCSEFDLNSSSHDSGIFEEEQNMDNFAINEQSKLSEAASKSERKSFKGPFYCNHCDKKFTRNFQLKLHLISVHQIGDGLQYSCHFCSKIFASNHSLSYHQKSVHYQQKPHFCSQCDRQFVLKSQLVSHMRIHTGEIKPRIFECHECGKKWPTKSDLRTHMRSHDPTMERPFKCDSCEKSFFTRGHLISHQLVHTGEKPFVCEFCNRSYQSVGNLNNHLSRRHTKELIHKEENYEDVCSIYTNNKQFEMILQEV